MGNPVPAAPFSDAVSEAHAPAWVQVHAAFSLQKHVLSEDPAMSGGGRSDAGRWAERCGAAGGASGRAPSMLRRVVAGGAARAGPRPAGAAAAAARDSMREPLGKSWQLSVWLAPTASRGPRLSLPRAPPNFSSPDIVGSLPRREGTPAPRVAARPHVPRAAAVPRSGARRGEEAGLALAPVGAGLAWASPSSGAARWRTLHPRTDSPGSHDALARGTGGGTSGVAAPARVPARPRHPPGSGWQSAKRLNGTEPPASPRPDQPQPPRATPRPGDPGPRPPTHPHSPQRPHPTPCGSGRRG